jgi:hypothetical protein
MTGTVQVRKVEKRNMEMRFVNSSQNYRRIAPEIIILRVLSISLLLYREATFGVRNLQKNFF